VDDVESLAHDLLVEAKRLVASGWCQRTVARDAKGRSVLPADPAAASWSAAGAIMRAAAREPAVQPFAVAMDELAAVIDAGPQTWNDAADRSAEDVVRALSDAVDSLERRRRPGRLAG
jgi:hypothetical protein